MYCLNAVSEDFRMKDKNTANSRHFFSEVKFVQHTVWKFQDFCITEILRQINFVDSRSAKTAVFAILRAVNFVHLVNFNLQKGYMANFESS